MKNRTYSTLSVPLFCFLVFCTTLAFSQKDTLHIYFKGLQPEVLDSNELKISNWAKTLKGKRYTVEVYSYYDFPEGKKDMILRAENVERLIVRKARDFTTIKFAGAVRGKKSQRSVLNIVYAVEGYVAPPTSAPVENKKDAPVTTSPAAKTSAPSETPVKAAPAETTTTNTTPKKVKKEKPAKTPPPVIKEEEPVRMPDEIYVAPEKKVEEETKPASPETPGNKEPEKETTPQ